MSDPNPAPAAGNQVRTLAFALVAVIPLGLIAWIAWLDWGYRRQAAARLELEALVGETRLVTEPVMLGVIGRWTGQGEWRDTVEARFAQKVQGILAPAGHAYFVENPAELNDTTAARLLEFPRLRRLELRRASITSGALQTIARLKRLESLTIELTPLKANDLQALSALSRLKELNLPQSDLDDAAMAAIGKIVRLETLSVRMNHIHDAGIAHLNSLPGLKELDLAFNPIGDAAIANLCERHRLTALDISSTTGVTDAGLEKLKTMSTLKTLALGGERASSPAAAALRKAFPQAHVDVQGSEPLP